MRLKILYRGHVSDCNLECPYCPFSKTRHDAADRARDRAAVDRFLAWIDEQGSRGWVFDILFTPYGEALIHPWYRRAMVELSRRPHVAKVAAQTNLSWDTAWTEGLEPSKAAFWATFHPGQAREDVFLRRCGELARRGISHSVGVVGLREHFAAIGNLRSSLPESTYLWVNAFKRDAGYYAAEEIAWIESIDPFFRHNLHHYPSRGLACPAGSAVVAIEGNGDLHRCHFVREPMGNIFRQDLASLLREEACPRETCHCHIGYVHVPSLGLAGLYGEGILERIPSPWPRKPSDAGCSAMSSSPNPG